MARHQDDLCSFDVPRNWDNRSVVAYAAPQRADGTSAGNIVVSRQRHDGPLQQLVDQRLRATAARSRGFLLRGQRPLQLAGREGVSVSFATAEHEKRMVVLPHAPGVALIITLAASSADAPAMAPLFERMLSSLSVTP